MQRYINHHQTPKLKEKGQENKKDSVFMIIQPRPYTGNNRSINAGMNTCNITHIKHQNSKRRVKQTELKIII